MFVIYKDGRRTFIRNTFSSYDAARVFIRKRIRKLFPYLSWSAPHYNPALGTLGYSVKKV